MRVIALRNFVANNLYFQKGDVLTDEQSEMISDCLDVLAKDQAISIDPENHPVPAEAPSQEEVISAPSDDDLGEIDAPKKRGSKKHK